jgi:hypothetical protein
LRLIGTSLRLLRRRLLLSGGRLLGCCRLRSRRLRRLLRQRGWCREQGRGSQQAGSGHSGGQRLSQWPRPCNPMIHSNDPLLLPLVAPNAHPNGCLVNRLSPH